LPRAFVGPCRMFQRSGLWLRRDCGLKYLPREVAYGKMCAMVAGAKIVRQELAGT
jgi:methionine synthase II (cobalamin-independent)